MGLDRALMTGLGLMVIGAALMIGWDGATPVASIVAAQVVSGAGVSLTLVASAADALAQFTPEEAGTGSALFNSLRQLGAAMGVAVPAVAFELLAAGSRTADATLAGSTAAFTIRLAVLALPLVLVVATRRSPRISPSRTSPSKA
jgi:hypothetical protein